MLNYNLVKQFDFVGTGVLDRPHKNNDTLFPNTSSTADAASAVPLPLRGRLTTSRIFVTLFAGLHPPKNKK